MSSIGPVVFSVPLLVLGTEEVVDLSDLGHPRLVRPLASALLEELGTRGGVRQRTRLQEAVQTVRDFVTFTAAALEGHGALALDDLEPGLLDAFEQALASRYTAGGRGPGRCSCCCGCFGGSMSPVLASSSWRLPIGLTPGGLPRRASPPSR
ncbi:hypothetical protein NKH18_48560 [Streptomyces sp. M10(2022)]